MCGCAETDLVQCWQTVVVPTSTNAQPLQKQQHPKRQRPYNSNKGTHHVDSSSERLLDKMIQETSHQHETKGPKQYQRSLKRTLHNGASSHTILPTNKNSCVHQPTPKIFVQQTTTILDTGKSAGFHPAPDPLAVRRQRTERRTKNKKRHLEFVYEQMNKRYGSKTIVSKPTWLRDAVTGGGFGY